jgi:hypothetical protein
MNNITSIYAYKVTVKRLADYMHEHKLKSLDETINYLLKRSLERKT